MDIIVIGSKDKDSLHRYDNDQEMYESCDIVIEMVDSNFWEVFSKDPSLIARLKAKFKETELLALYWTKNKLMTKNSLKSDHISLLFKHRGTMKHISELQATLSNFFDWHKSRLNCLGQILQALFVVRTSQSNSDCFSLQDRCQGGVFLS